MTREEAIRILASSCIPGSKQTEALETLIPELAESEDERMMSRIIDGFKNFSRSASKWNNIPVEEVIAYLEKQKENPKSADSIPSDCVSDAKCEDRWHKVGDSLPDNPREVLCKDEAGNYFIGRYYVGEGWEISNYDDEDKPHHLNPPVSKWIDFPLEKQKDLTTENIYKHSRERMSFWNGQQKEQKPAESISQLAVQGKGVYKICPRCKERMVRDDSMVYTSMPPQYRYECPKCGESECDTVMYDNPEMEEQKPEWSEEDELMMKAIIGILDENDHPKLCSWLKSLRPQPQGTYKQVIHTIFGMLKDKDFYEIQPSHRVSLLNDIRVKCKDAIECAPILDEPSWKPSEEQMKALLNAEGFLRAGLQHDSAKTIAELYEQLKKL